MARINRGRIEALEPHEVFVYGSNLAGLHNLGAARLAKERYGARHGVGQGLTGQSYALPTKDGLLRVLPLEAIGEQMQRLGETATAHPDRVFYLTRVGQGLAGYDDGQIRPLIEQAGLPANVKPYWEWESSGGGVAVQPPAAAAGSTVQGVPFEIVASRGPGASFDVLGMREKGQTMATVSAPFEPGWLGNPFVAVDAGGRLSREQATAAFGELVREKAQDAAWRDAFLSLRGKRIGYYRPEEPAIHLHELQRWIAEQDGGPAVAGVAEAAAGPRRVQLELALDGGGSPPPPPPPPPPAVVMAEPPEPQSGPGPAPQASAPPPPPDDPVVIAVQEDPKRKAGDLLPWLLAAAGGAAAGGGLAYLMQQGQAPQGGSG